MAPEPGSVPRLLLNLVALFIMLSLGFGYIVRMNIANIMTLLVDDNNNITLDIYLIELPYTITLYGSASDC